MATSDRDESSQDAILVAPSPDVVSVASSQDAVLAAPSQDAILIALMGQTGTGKSSFINKATGASLEVGRFLKSCTRFSIPKFAPHRTNKYLSTNERK
jgi:putative ribosome biogenesis GTPase RsgA